VLFVTERDCAVFSTESTYIVPRARAVVEPRKHPSVVPAIELAKRKER